MFGDHFYNERVRKSVATFGALFDEIYIVKKGSSGSFEQMRVPFSYGPKRKFIERIAEMDRGEDNERQVAIRLPRMSFEMVSISYDATRQLPKVNNQRKRLEDGSYGKVYVGVPYILGFSLNVYAKSQDEALQVVEQIIPYFNPQYTVSMRPYEQFDDMIEDCIITLSSVAPQDDYENELAARRTIIYTLDFEMKVNFYGPAPSEEDQNKVIRKIIANIYNIEDSDQLYQSFRVTLDPFMASEDSDYSLICELKDSDG